MSYNIQSFLSTTPSSTVGIALKNVIKDIISRLDSVESSATSHITDVLQGEALTSLKNDENVVVLGDLATVNLVSNKIPSELLPTLSISDTYVCEDESVTDLESLSTWVSSQEPTPETGDVIVVTNGTDLAGNYILNGAGEIVKLSFGLDTYTKEGTISVIQKMINMNNDNINAQLDEIITNINASIEKTVVDTVNNNNVATVNPIADRVTALEGKVSTDEATLAGLALTKADKSDLDSLVTTVSDNKQLAYDQLVTVQDALAGDIASVSAAVTAGDQSLQKQINDLQSTISGLTAELTELKAIVAEIKPKTDEIELVED